MNRLWRELGVAQRRFLDPAEYRRYEEDGRALSLFTDLPRLEAHLLELAPEDARLIRELCRAIDTLGALEMPLDDPWTWGGFTQYVRMLTVLGSFRRDSRMSTAEVSARIRNPFFRRAFQALFSVPEAPVSALLMGLAVQC
jgi:phytoene dehydrogenase-like protein